MDLRNLRYFQAVAAAGRITTAARELGVTQPALSMALARLEEELGVVLFDRDHRGAHLTESGRALLSAVTQAMTLLEEAQQHLRGLEDEPVGRFVLGCPSALGCYLLPVLLPELLDAYPRLELVVRAGTSREIEAAVLRRELSFGLCTHTPQLAELVRLELFQDEVSVVAPVHGAAGKTPRSWGEASAALRRATMFYAAAMPQATEILEALARRGVSPARQVDCGDVHMVAEAALARGSRDSLAILPRRVAEHRHGARLSPLHARLPTVTDTIRLLYRSDMHRTRAASLLTDAIVSRARGLAA
ncbi:MAG: LysR family transcriptional regulator [Kofleriaceae bacterium]